MKTISKQRMDKKIKDLAKNKTFLHSTLPYYERFFLNFFFLFIFLFFVVISFFLFFPFRYSIKMYLMKQNTNDLLSPLHFPFLLSLCQNKCLPPLIFPSFLLKLFQLWWNLRLNTIHLVPCSFEVTVKTKLTPTTITQPSLFFPYLSLVFKPFFSLYNFSNSPPSSSISSIEKM